MYCEIYFSIFVSYTKVDCEMRPFLFNVVTIFSFVYNVWDSNFKFVIKSKNINNYKNNLQSLNSYQIKIDHSEVLEFFYIKKFLYENINENTFWKSSVYNENPIINYNKKQSKKLYKKSNLIQNNKKNNKNKLNNLSQK